MGLGQGELGSSSAQGPCCLSLQAAHVLLQSGPWGCLSLLVLALYSVSK